MKHIRQPIQACFVVAVAAAIILCLCIPRASAWSRGHFYIIGTGPAGAQTATLQALETMKRMDLIIATKKHAQLFDQYIDRESVLFDPWKGFWDYRGKKLNELSAEEKADFRVERFRIRDERVKKIKDFLSRGKDVGLLDSGNPCLFGPSHWYIEHFDKQDIVIIPGMGCDAAAMAAIGKSSIPSHDTRFVMQTSPFFLEDRAYGDHSDPKDRQILKDLAKYPATMVLYMALRDPVKLFGELGEVLPADMPCAVVFWAGYPDRERIVRGTVADMGAKLANDNEKFMGLLFIGRFLEGKPYENAMKRLQKKS